MVKKLKHHKKAKKKQKISEPVESEVPITNEPTKEKGKKKTKKSKKKTPKNRALENLNKLVEAYKKDQKKYDQFVERIDKWFVENLKKILNIFEELDSDKTGELTYEQFKAGLIDYNIPCNLIELHLLATLLDTDGNLGIDFNEFEKGIRYFRIVEGESSPYRETERIIKLLEANDCKWINCNLKFLTFENHKEHPGHFQYILPSDTYVLHMMNIIKEEKRYLTDSIQIFRENSKSIEHLLPEDKTLDELGFRGGSYYNPRELILFYDFDPAVWYKHPLILETM